MVRWLAPLALVALGTAAFGAVAAPREAVPAWLGWFAVSAGGLAFAARGLEAGPRFARGALFGAALIGSACLVPPVSLSDDVERYVWDGHLVASGRDPFAARPVDVVGFDPHLDEAALARLNSPRYYSVYPPLAQLVFAAGAGLERATGLSATRVLRLLFLLAGLLAAWAFLHVAKRRGLSPGWTLAFVWNPLLWWELVAGAHTEALMLAPLLLAVDAVVDDRPARAGALLGLAACAKLTALLIGPVLLVFAWRRVRWRALALAAAPALLALASLPFASETLLPHVRESLTLFTADFSFNAPVYYAVRDAMGYVAGLTPSMDAQIVPALQALALLWLLGCALAPGRDETRLWSALAYAYVGYLLLSRVFHPWYVLPALAFGALGRSRAIVALSLTVPLSYLRYTLDVEAPWVLALELAPFVALAALDLRRPDAGSSSAVLFPMTTTARNAAKP